jgi:hypothetical protein
MGVDKIIGGAGELLLRLFGNTLPVPSVWCWSVYLFTDRLCAEYKAKYVLHVICLKGYSW